MTLGFVVVVVVSMWFALRRAAKAGKLKERSDTLGKVLSNVEKANKARDELNDPDKRDKLRKKYTRDK